MTSEHHRQPYITKALSYPYPRPDHSFLLKNGKISLLTCAPDFSGRTPVIACGSNGSPEQLSRKFTPETNNEIYVTCALLTGFLCTYSAHLTAYGSIPATMASFPDHQTNCHVTWLDDAQLSLMHSSEALGVNYRYSRLDHITLESEFHTPLQSAFAYISLHGSLCIGGSPIEISGISRETHSPIKRMSQSEIQKSAMTYLQLDNTLEEFIDSNINNDMLRQEHTRRLQPVSRQFAFKHEHIQQTE